MCSDKAIDKTWLLSVNHLALTRVKLKFYIGRLRNKVYDMLTCVKAVPAASVVLVMWWGSVTFITMASLFSGGITDSHPGAVNHRVYVHFRIF